MPVTSYFEPNAPRHATLTSSAGDHTRYVRMMATIAPYVGNGAASGPRLGWKSAELSAQVRLIAPLYGSLRAFIPNRI